MDDLSELLCEVTPSDEQKWVKMGNIDFQNSRQENFVKIASVWSVFQLNLLSKEFLAKIYWTQLQEYLVQMGMKQKCEFEKII